MRDLAEIVLIRCAPRLATHMLVTIRGATFTLDTFRGRTCINSLSFSSVSRWRSRALGLRSPAAEWLPRELQSHGLGDLPAGASTTIALEPSLALRHDFELPSAVRAELDSAVALYLERQVPLPSDQVYMDWRVTHPDPQRQRLHVQLLVVRREMVDQLREYVSGWGLRPVRIALDGRDPASAADSGLGAPGALRGNFLPRSFGALRMRLARTERRLAMLAIALAACLLVLILGQRSYERHRVNAELHRTEQLARSARDFARKLDIESAPARELTAKMSSADCLNVLAGLTRLIPLDSWVYDLKIDPGKDSSMTIELAGFAPAATTLTELLAKAPALQQVRLLSATSAGVAAAQDRLQIAAMWVGP